jgi:hypothetical protein
LEDYLVFAYSLVKGRPVTYSTPRFFAFDIQRIQSMESFKIIEVFIREWMKNRNINSINERFAIPKIETITGLVDDLTDLYGADEKK